MMPIATHILNRRCNQFLPLSFVELLELPVIALHGRYVCAARTIGLHMQGPLLRGYKKMDPVWIKIRRKH